MQELWPFLCKGLLKTQYVFPVCLMEKVSDEGFNFLRYAFKQVVLFGTLILLINTSCDRDHAW